MKGVCDQSNLRDQIPQLWLLPQSVILRAASTFGSTRAFGALRECTQVATEQCQTAPARFAER